MIKQKRSLTDLFSFSTACMVSWTWADHLSSTCWVEDNRNPANVNSQVRLTGKTV